MTGTTHVAIALAGGLAYMAATGDVPGGTGWAALVIGGLAPDIDSGGGTIARPGSLFGKLLPRYLVKVLDQIGMFISGLIRSILGHRNATHWPVWAVIMMMLATKLGMAWLWWFALGYALHILGDFCTKSGVPLLGPVLTWDIKWSPIRTGTWPEWLIINPALWGLIFYYGWSYIPGEARAWLYQFGGHLLSSL